MLKMSTRTVSTSSLIYYIVLTCTHRNHHHPARGHPKHTEYTAKTDPYSPASSHHCSKEGSIQNTEDGHCQKTDPLIADRYHHHTANNGHAKKKLEKIHAQHLPYNKKQTPRLSPVVPRYIPFAHMLPALQDEEGGRGIM
jgi:hypothetical protein